jgi:hypothetical protein
MVCLDQEGKRLAVIQSNDFRSTYIKGLDVGACWEIWNYIATDWDHLSTRDMAGPNYSIHPAMYFHPVSPSTCFSLWGLPSPLSKWTLWLLLSATQKADDCNYTMQCQRSRISGSELQLFFRLRAYKSCKTIICRAPPPAWPNADHHLILILKCNLIISIPFSCATSSNSCSTL